MIFFVFRDSDLLLSIADEIDVVLQELRLDLVLQVSEESIVSLLWRKRGRKDRRGETQRLWKVSLYIVTLHDDNFMIFNDIRFKPGLILPVCYVALLGNHIHFYIWGKKKKKEVHVIIPNTPRSYNNKNNAVHAKNPLNVLKDSISAPSRQHRPSGSAAKTKQIKSG